MKVIDRSSYIASPGPLTFMDRIQGSVKHGLSWPLEFESQQTCIDTLGKSLGDDFTLFRNVSLNDLEVPIPLVLVGPPGIFVIYVTTLIGSFRAKEEEWLSLESPRKPKPVTPNLPVRTSLLAQAVDIHLAKNGVTAPRSRPVLFCTNPHMFVECARSIVEVVMGETIEFFAANISKEPSIYGPDHLQKILDGMLPIPEPEPGGLPAAGNLEAETQKPNPSEQGKTRRGLKYRFNRGQWITLGVIAFFEVVALIIVIILTVQSLGS